jgi:hypothetical protein
MRKLFWFVLSALIFLFSCAKDAETVVPETSSAYAGLAVGKYVIFDVDSIAYDDFDASIDTTSYQVKETVDSKFTDLEGDDAFKIIRYRRDSTSQNWFIIDIWTSKISLTNFQKNEENSNYVKLIFPVRADKTWDGNSRNGNSTQEYRYTAVHQAQVIGGNALTEVLTVLQFDSPEKLIRPSFFEERYAKGIGMVYKRSFSLTRADLNPNTPWLGYDITMTLSSYGG